MRSTTRTATIFAAFGLAFLPSGCGADDVETQAHEWAENSLERHYGEFLDCMESSAGNWSDSTELDESVVECGYTEIMGKTEGQILEEYPEIPRGVPTIVVSGNRTEDRFVFDLIAQGTGYAESGITSARIHLVTCWRGSFVVEDGTLQGGERADCLPVIIDNLSPDESVPYEQIK